MSLVYLTPPAPTVFAHIIHTPNSVTSLEIFTMYQVRTMARTLVIWLAIAAVVRSAQEELGTVIGIDLGTTYSCVGIFKYGRVEIIANDQGNRITPSYVAFLPNGDRLIGDAAKNQITSNPENTVFNVKRLIGLRWGDPAIEQDMEFYPFKVVNKNDKPHVEVPVGKGETKVFAPEEISAMIMMKMKGIAEGYVGEKVTNAVVTVPAYFNDGQRRATKDAGRIAGLNVLKIINEPTAAGLAYGWDKKDGMHTILVYDLGGGTFDVTVLAINNGEFKVLATNGDTHLGGEDFDQCIMKHFMELYMKKFGKEISTNTRSMQKLRREVEKAKRILSSQLSVSIEIDSFFDGKDFSEKLTRAKFEELNKDMFQKTMEPVNRVLEDANKKISEVDEIILVGGSTRIPKIQQLVTDFFGGKKPSRDINPDEAVAYGAALQAGVMAGEEESLVIVDVNPLSMGIMTVGGIMTVLIPRNSVIPTKRSKIFSTHWDNQRVVAIEVFEGENPMTAKNHALGEFLLTDIPAAPRGVPAINVTFEFDLNSILSVTAEELSTNNRKSIAIDKKQNSLTPEEIERMINEAEQFTDKFEQNKERIEARNSLETFLYWLQNQLADDTNLGGKLSENEKDDLMDVVTEQIDWLESNEDADISLINAQKKALQDILQPIIKKIYGNGSEEPPPEYQNTWHDEL